ncbi:unnamed protein product [Paramecium sonneborni]|nr:unnamed protein product [Paramecium sonneborni]
MDQKNNVEQHLKYQIELRFLIIKREKWICNYRRLKRITRSIRKDKQKCEHNEFQIRKIQQKRIVLDESNAHLCFGLDIFNNLNKTLEACTLNHFRFYSSNIKLGQEFPEIQATIDAVFQEKNVNVSIKQPSSFGVPSVRSSVSSASSQGRRRLRSYQQVIKQKIYNFYQLYLKSIFQMNVLQ